MIVLAIVATIGALIWSFGVMFANGMRSSPGKFQGGGTIIAAWVVVVILWLAWSVDKAASTRDLDGRYANSRLKPWFDILKSGKGPCCSDADGWALADVDWESRGDKYRVRVPRHQFLPSKDQPTPPAGIEMVWVDVEDDAVIKEPNRAGRTMVWPIWGYGGLTIRCFMPGPMT